MALAPHRWQQVDALFHATLERPAEEREAFLRQACGDDLDLYREVESLLRHTNSSSELLQRPVWAAVSPASARLSPDSMFGIYRIKSLLGCGGMGEVYRATDTQLHREVAIKVLPPAFVSDADRLARFEREARVLAALNHPNIAAIYCLEQASGLRGLVLELVEGADLAERLRKGPLNVPDALVIARQVADALDAAHNRGIVQRDLKPGNIKLTPEGVVKVLDFGLAKLDPHRPDAADGDTSTINADATQPGAVLGTASYMSPEQARGEAVDKRTDIWAFGCVLYEMLTGRRPFSGRTVPDLIVSILQADPDWNALPPELPANVHRLIRRCLAKDLRRRLHDIADARLELDDSIRGSQPGIEDARASVTATSPKRRATPWIALSLATLGAILLAVAGWTLYRRQSGHVQQTLGPRFTRVSWEPGLATEPAISSDGRMVVYASDRSGEDHLDLWVQHLNGGEPLRRTRGPADNREPDFSPDGSSIVYRSSGTNAIYVIPTLGGTPRLLAPEGRRPKFSPDGSRIAYWTGQGIVQPTRAPLASKVFVIPAVGGTPAQVAPQFANSRNPIWSPDGQSVLFWGHRSDKEEYDWWFAKNLNELIPIGAEGAIGKLGFAGKGDLRTGDWLAQNWTRQGVWFSANLDGNINVWIMLVSQESGRIEGPPRRVTSGPGDDFAPSADRNGRLVFQHAESTSGSFLLPLDPNTGKVAGPRKTLRLDLSLEAGRHSMSDDGRWLTYVKHRGRVTQIVIRNMQTGEERELTSFPYRSVNATISRDGAFVAYSDNYPPSTGYVVKSSGGIVRKICDDCVLFGWLADNKSILGINRTRTIVRIIDVESGAPREVLRGEGLTRPHLSWDDRWLAFRTASRIWIARFRPGIAAQKADWIPVLDVAGEYERHCGWSPDGKLLYLLLDRDGFRCLSAQRIDPESGKPQGQPFAVQHFHSPRWDFVSTPFGNGIIRSGFVFNVPETTGGIWLMEP